MRLVAAVGLTGVALRLMDDIVDAARDRLGGARAPALADERQAAEVVPYALAALVVAAALAPRETAALFGAAYAVGMAGERDVRLPTGLRSSHEALVALLGACWLAGPRLTAGAAGVMLAVQAFDDLADAGADRRAGARNLAVQWGGGEAWLLGLTALAVAATLTPALTAIVLALVPVVERVGRRPQRTPWGARGGRPA